MNAFLIAASFTLCCAISAAAADLCFLRSVGYLATCPEGNWAVGAEGFATSIEDACPETEAPSVDLTISASSTDPFVTVAPLTGSETSLYLWWVSYLPPNPESPGLAVLFCDVIGDIAVLGFESQYFSDLSANPEGNHWSLMVDLACDAGKEGSQVLGEFRVAGPTATEAETWGRIKAIYR